MSEKVENVKAAADGLSVFERFMEMLKKYGVLRTIGSALIFVVFCYLAYIAVNPGAVFRRYEDYIAKQHAVSTEYRIQSFPMVRKSLNMLAIETGADRAFIIEYHNGKNNPTGLQWQYGDMTFLNDSAVEGIADEFQNISLSRYPIFYEIFENVYWCGSIEEMIGVDKRFALRAEANDVKYMAFETIYGSELSEIGVVGVSFTEDEAIPDTKELLKTLNKYSNTLAPLLDGKNAFNKKKKD